MKKVVMLLIFVGNLVFSQTTYYVRNGGNDNSDGLSDATAWASLSRVRQMKYRAGDSILLRRGGVWTEILQVPLCSGTRGNPITYGSYGDGADPIINAQHIRPYCIDLSLPNLSWILFKDLDCRNAARVCVFMNEYGGSHLVFERVAASGSSSMGFSLSKADSITLRDCTARDNGTTRLDHGIYIKDSQGFLIDHCTADNNAGAGIHQYLCRSGIIRYNTVRSNGLTATRDGAGIIIWTAEAARVDCYYNFVFNSAGRGVSIRNCVAGTTINFENNTVASTQGTGLYIGENPAGVTVNVRNNILAFSTENDLEVDSPSSTTLLDYNAYYHPSGSRARYNGVTYRMPDPSALKAGTLGANSITNDPQFVDITRGPAIKDSSPCRDAGLDVGLTRDFTGATVVPTHIGRVDIGSYEVASSSPEGARDAEAPPTRSYALLQNYPNPFNPTTQIAFQLQEEGRVTLTVYDALGREVAALADSTYAAGMHVIPFSARQFPSGTYFYRLHADGFSATRAMMLMR